jgi:hypothetical protein
MSTMIVSAIPLKVIGSMSSPVGNAIGQLIPVFLVSQHFQSDTDDPDSNGHYNVHGMDSLMVTELVICIFALILTGGLKIESL